MHFPPAFDPQHFTQLLAAARGGDAEALGEFLFAYRGFLRAMAARNIVGPVRAKLDASDIVQQTLSEAAAKFEQFVGMAPHELEGWLRAGLLNNVRDCQRRFGTRRRAISREVSLDADAALQRKLPSNLPSPSSRILKEEHRQIVDQAMARLPAEYGEVLALRHRESLSFDEIARRMDRSANAVRKLWARAVTKLRDELLCEPRLRVS